MYPFGLDRNAAGQGTTPEGLQRILACRYSQPGVIAGLELTPSNTTMQITVGWGAAAVQLASGLLVEVPVDPAPLTLAAAPASGSRTDLVIVTGAAGVSAGVVSIASTVPAGAQEIGRVTVPAGATTAAQCTISSDRLWALSTGGSQGVIAEWQETPSWGAQIPAAQQTLCTLRISPQPQPRRIEMILQSCLFMTSGTASTVYDILVDNVQSAAIELSSTTYWEAKHTHTYATVSAGVAHTITLKRRPETGDRPQMFGGAHQGVLWPATYLKVQDLGASRG